MLLAIDIGNTTITVGLLNGLKVRKSSRIETTLPKAKLEKQFKRILTSWKLRNNALEAVAICSVVPTDLLIVKSVIKSQLKVPVYTIGKDILVPIKNKYKNPRQVGQDRLVGAFAAMQFYGTPVVVIDFGTAITFDVVSANKEYLGGIIVPGIRLSAESLFAKTAMLPKVHIKTPNELIGRDTQGSILSGLFYGYGAMCEGLIRQLSRELRSQSVKVVVTGGYSKFMRKFISGIKAVDEDLVFKGIELVYRVKALKVLI